MLIFTAIFLLLAYSTIFTKSLLRSGSPQLYNLIKSRFLPTSSMNCLKSEKERKPFLAETSLCPVGQRGQRRLHTLPDSIVILAG